LIDLEDKTLAADKSALTVDVNFPALKVQFLFTFLNISHIYVTDNGKLAGIITKEDFIKKSAAIN
jgi:signal-transduction protein with cAMP-binding, CBS, and nucleotidyltransferase domain